MKIRALLITAILASGSLFGKVVQSNRFDTITEHLAPGTIVLVDLDNTLFQGKEAVGHTDFFYDMKAKLLAQGFESKTASEMLQDEWLMIQERAEVLPVEETTPEYIASLQAEGVTVIGFTHRNPNLAPATLRQIASLGIDFTKTAPVAEDFELPMDPVVRYRSGVIFSSGHHLKSNVFNTFSEMTGYKPTKIVFIDDKYDNVQDLEDKLPQDIEYVGIYYTAVNEETTQYDPKIAAVQRKFLHGLMSNSDAAMLHTLQAHDDPEETLAMDE